MSVESSAGFDARELSELNDKLLKLAGTTYPNFFVSKGMI